MNDHPSPKQDARKGNFQRVVGGATVVFAIIALVLLNGTIENIPTIPRVIANFIALLAAIFGASHYSDAERHFVKSASQVIGSDGRPQILYLRSFDGEADINLEENILAKVVDEIGPLIAIGRPGDDLPPLGAARDYVSDANWKDHVAGLMKQSSLVILVAGKTEGLTWELAECYRRVPHDRLIVLVHDNESAYDAFSRSSGNFGLPITCPQFPDSEARRFRAGEFCGLLYFDSNWRGTFIGFENAATKAGSGVDIDNKNSRMSTRFRLALAKANLPPDVALANPGFNWVRFGLWGYLAVALAVVAIVALVSTSR